MTNLELKKLRRIELIELLLELTEENEQLLKENETLRKRLEDRKLLLEKAGSIAQASLEITGIFEKAQEAADLYLENIRDQKESQDYGTERGKENSSGCSKDFDKNAPDNKLINNQEEGTDEHGEPEETNI